jgi:hypothetical protein
MEISGTENRIHHSGKAELRKGQSKKDTMALSKVNQNSMLARNVPKMMAVITFQQ